MAGSSPRAASPPRAEARPGAGPRRVPADDGSHRVEVPRVRRGGDRRHLHAGSGRHDLRVQAVGRGQGRPRGKPRERPRPRARRREGPDRADLRPGRRRDRGAQQEPRRHRAPGGDRERAVPQVPVPPDDRPRPRRPRRAGGGRPGPDAAPPRGRDDGRGEERRDQRHDHLDAVQGEARRGEVYPRRPEDERHEGLGGSAAPPRPGHHRAEEGGQRPDLGRGGDGGALPPPLRVARRPEHRTVQRGDPGPEGPRRGPREDRRKAEVGRGRLHRADALHRRRHRRAGRPDDDGPARDRGLGREARPEGAGRRHPPHPRHPAPVGGHHHRDDQGEPPVPDLLHDTNADRLPDDPRPDGAEQLLSGGHALPRSGDVVRHAYPRRLHQRRGDEGALPLPEEAGEADLRRERHGRPRDRRRRREREPGPARTMPIRCTTRRRGSWCASGWPRSPSCSGGSRSASRAPASSST